MPDYLDRDITGEKGDATAQIDASLPAGLTPELVAAITKEFKDAVAGLRQNAVNTVRAEMSGRLQRATNRFWRICVVVRAFVETMKAEGMVDEMDRQVAVLSVLSREYGLEHNEAAMQYLRTKLLRNVGNT